MRKNTLMTLTLFVIMGWAIGFVAPQQVAAQVELADGGGAFIELNINVTDAPKLGADNTTVLIAANAFKAKFMVGTSTGWGVYISPDETKPENGTTPDTYLFIAAKKSTEAGDNPMIDYVNNGAINTSTLDKAKVYYIGIYYDYATDEIQERRYADGTDLSTGTIATTRWTVVSGTAGTTPETVAEWDFQTQGTTAELATVITADVTGATVGGTPEKVSLTTGGTVAADTTGAEILGRGVVYGTAQNPTLETGTKVADASPAVGAFVSTITGLEKGTTYYIRAYVTNAAGTAYGNQLPPYTASLPVLTDITTTATPGATSIAFAISGGATDITEKGVCVATTENPTDATTGVKCGVATDGKVTISGLTAATPYFYNTYAKNVIGTSYRNAGAASKTTTLVLGDFTGTDNIAGLADLVICVQVATGQNVTGVRLGADVNGDGKIGMVDAEYLLRKLANPAK